MPMVMISLKRGRSFNYMNDVLRLFGELFLIACINFIIIAFADETKMSQYISRITNIACTAAALLILLRFVVSHLMPEVNQVFRVIL